MKQLLQDWAVFRTTVDHPLYAYSPVEDRKWVRFVSHLGFRPTGESILCNNGERRQLYLSTKELSTDVDNLHPATAGDQHH